MATGTVKWFNDAKGYGFITPQRLEQPVPSEGETNRRDRLALVERLVASGASRLTAERIVAIERGEAAPGRARRHTQSRR